MNAAASLYEQHTFQYGDYTLAYETCGEGPPVVLMHGVLLDSLVYRELGTRFAAEGCRVILFDLLGHGRSDKSNDPKDYRAEHFTDQLIGLLDHLGIDQAMIGGVSLGSVVTLHMAARAPERVSAMFLEMPVMEWSAPWAAVILAPILFTARYLSPAYRPLSRLVKRLPRPRKLSQEWLGSLMNAGSLDPEIAAAILHGCLVGPAVPTEAARHAMHMPALVIGHGGDKLHSVEDARVLAEQLPNARLVEARHAIEMRTKPDRLWPQIVEFVTEYVGSYETSVTAGSLGAAAVDRGLKQRFEETLERVRSAPADGPFKPSNELKLKMYALYRQASDGDVQGKRPGMLDVVARFKYDAWAAVKGLSAEAAMQRYVDEVEKLEKKHG